MRSVVRADTCRYMLRLVLMNMTDQPGGGTQILLKPFETATPPPSSLTHNKPPDESHGPEPSTSPIPPLQLAGAGLRGCSTRRGFQAANLSGMLVWLRSFYTGLCALQNNLHLVSNFCPCMSQKVLLFLKQMMKI